MLNNWWRALTSSIGMKIVMAVSGFVLVLFIFAHMLGNLEIFGGQDSENHYGALLRTLPPLLWVMRFGLFVLVVAHIASSIRLTVLNQAARPQGYAKKKNITTGIAARTMIWTGALVGVFVVYHLMHFTIRNIVPEYKTMEDAQGRHDVYRMVTDAFGNHRGVAFFYFAAMLFLGLHVSHGFGSMFQTLGMSHPKYHAALRKASPAFAVLVVLGFVSVPLAVLLGLVKPPGGF